MQTCVVTMFFDIGGVRPRSFYMEHGKHILSLKAPMVVFCDEDTHAELAESRNGLPTVFVVKRISDYDSFQTLLPIINQNREHRPSLDSRNTSEYFLLCTFKFHALQVASQRMPDCTHYMWVDFGAAHVLRSIPDALYPILSSPRNGIACCYIHYRPSSELYPMSNYVGGKCGIAGGFLTVEKAYVSKLYTSFMSILHQQILEGVGHSDEQVLIYVHNKHPEWFSVYFGDYYSLATNYHRSVEDHDCIRNHFIRNAAGSDLALEASRSME